jgi:iron complex outermembrane receptor protein
VTTSELLERGFFSDFDEFDLEQLIQGLSSVTASVAARTEQVSDQAPASVSIVTADDIRALGAQTLAEVLSTVPGVDITVDALGRPRISMRGVASGVTGGASEGVLILMNGQRLDEPIEGGATALNLAIPVGNIQKIEVLRGPGSALYGSGAVSGVIDIITFSQEDFTGVEAFVGGGSFATQRYALRLGSEGRNLKIAGFLQFEDSSGARRLVPEDAQTLIDRSLGPEGIPAASLAPSRATDGLRVLETNYTATLRSWEFGIRVSNQRSPGFIGVAESLGDVNDLIHRQVTLSVQNTQVFQSGWRLVNRATLATNSLKRVLQLFPPEFTQPLGDLGSVTYPSGVFVQEELTSRRYGLESMGSRTFGPHALTGGVSVGRESTSDNELLSNYDYRKGLPLLMFEPLDGAVADEGRGVVGAFVQDIWSPVSRLSLTGGLRFDHYEGVGGNVSPRLAAVWTFPRNVSLKLLYGRAFRVPTFAEQSFSLPGYEGNGRLDPVTLDNLEAALAYNNPARRLRFSASAYLSYLRNPIVAQGTFEPGTSRPVVNGAGSDIRGFELQVRRGFGLGGSAFVNYSHQTVDSSEGGAWAPEVPAHLGNLGVTFSVAGRVHITPSMIFRSGSPRQPGDPRLDLSGHALLNLSAQVPDLYRGFAVSISMRNLLNEAYRDPSPMGGVPGDYPRPGRSLFLSATYQF